MSTTQSRIDSISLVSVMSTDQDRSIEFYEALGFEKRTDVPFGDKYRWVEVYPPTGSTGIALDATAAGNRQDRRRDRDHPHHRRHRRHPCRAPIERRGR